MPPQSMQVISVSASKAPFSQAIKIGRYRPPMRVIGGLAKGRRLTAPPGLDVRPTSDRVRQALFTMVEAHLGDLQGARVADLACGSGALGIEALSRGAAACTFVDTSIRSLRAAQANLVAVGLAGSSAQFVKGDLVRWATATPSEVFDLVLVDPPYVWDEWPILLAALAGSTEAVAVESDREVVPIDGWASLRSRRHGGTVVSVLVPDREFDR